MATFTFTGDAGLITKLNKMENTDEICQRVLNACVGPLIKNVKRGYAAHHKTGDLEKSIQATKPKEGKDGWYICVRPTGVSKTTVGESGKAYERKAPMRNAEIAVYMEYGTKKQAANPVIAPAISTSEAEVKAEMQKEYDRAIGE